MAKANVALLLLGLTSTVFGKVVKQISDRSGNITSPNYPNPYPGDQDITWIFKVKAGHAVVLHFVTFVVGDSAEEACVGDFVKIKAKGKNKSLKYCGNSATNDEYAPPIGRDLEFRSKSVKMIFVSDSKVGPSPKGFMAIYNIVPIVCQLPSQNTGIRNAENTTGLTSFAYGEIISFKCDERWYEMTSDATEWICGVDALWQPHDTEKSDNGIDSIPECSPVCGLKGNKRISRSRRLIIYGRPVKHAGEWPWVAFIDLFGQGLTAARFCGGSLVSTRTVVTAAHCVARTYTKAIRVFIGMSERENTDYSTVQTFRISKMYEHENFTEGAFDNDIAILILETSVKIGLYARPICLPRSKKEKALPELAGTDEIHQKTGVVAGWGLTEDGIFPSILNSVRVRPIDQKTCMQSFEKNKPRSFGDIKITENMICAGYPGNERNRDSCHGDSGGPLMFKDPTNNKFFLNGIVSFGSTKKCGGGTFGIYTRVSKYIEWIDSRIIH